MWVWWLINVVGAYATLRALCKRDHVLINQWTLFWPCFTIVFLVLDIFGVEPVVQLVIAFSLAYNDAHGARFLVETVLIPLVDRYGPMAEFVINRLLLKLIMIGLRYWARFDRKLRSFWRLLYLTKLRIHAWWLALKTEAQEESIDNIGSK